MTLFSSLSFQQSRDPSRDFGKTQPLSLFLFVVVVARQTSLHVSVIPLSCVHVVPLIHLLLSFGATKKKLRKGSVTICFSSALHDATTSRRRRSFYSWPGAEIRAGCGFLRTSGVDRKPQPSTCMPRLEVAQQKSQERSKRSAHRE